MFLCFPFIRPFNEHKLDFTSTAFVFLGYCSQQHGYRCLDSDGRVYVSTHVHFHEYVFPFADKKGKFMTSFAPKNTCISPPFFLPFACPYTPSDNCNVSRTYPRPSTKTSVSISSWTCLATSLSCVHPNHNDVTSELPLHVF